MKTLGISELNEYVNENIVNFHENKIDRLKRLTLDKLLKKNPYLYKAKYLESASLLISGFLEAFLSSSEEKMFGDFLEGLAIFISSKTRGGHESGITGMDLEIIETPNHFLISIKSGPNWGNNAQKTRLAQDFDRASRVVRQHNADINVKTILGICYGKTRTALQERGYWKLVGQNFWTFISGNKDLYTDIIEPIGYRAKEHNDDFEKNKNQLLNIMIDDFLEEYRMSNGSINWPKLVNFNSGNFDLSNHNI